MEVGYCKESIEFQLYLVIFLFLTSNLALLHSQLMKYSQVPHKLYHREFYSKWMSSETLVYLTQNQKTNRMPFLNLYLFHFFFQVLIGLFNFLMFGNLNKNLN